MQFDGLSRLSHDFPYHAGSAIVSDLDAVERRVPGRFWYAVAAILFFGSVLFPAPFVLWTLFSQNDAVPRLVAPETITVRLDRGTYTVFSDSRAVIGGEIVISQGSISGLRMRVRGAGGEEIPVEAAKFGARYNYGGQTGIGILQFSIPQSGEYTIAADYREKSGSQRALLSIRKDFVGGLFGSILFAVSAGIIGAFLGTAIFLRTLWKRRALLLQGMRVNIRNMGENVRQSARGAGYTPPGSAEGKSPVEHQYDRDK